MYKLIPLLLVGIPVAISDLKYHRIPNRLLLGLWLIDETFQLNRGWRLEWPDHLRAISFFIAGLVLSHFMKMGIGMGDIKLFALLGLFLGGFTISMVALTYAALIALVYALVARKRSVPFGPALIMGAALVILGG